MKNISWLLPVLCSGTILAGAQRIEVTSSKNNTLKEVDFFRKYESEVRKTVVQKNFPDREKNCMQVHFSRDRNFRGLQCSCRFRPWQIVSSAKWYSDLETASRMGYFIAAAWQNIPEPEENGRLPLWLTAAIFRRIDSEKLTGRLLRLSRRFPVAEALMEAGITPALPALVEPGAEKFQRTERIWYDEFSHLLLLLTRKRTTMLGSLHTTSDLERVFRPTRVREKGADWRTEIAECLPDAMWSRLHFPPASRLETERKKLFTRAWPEMDKEGKLTGKQLSCQAEDFPEKVKDRQDSAAMLAAFAGELRNFAEKLPYEQMMNLRKMARALEKSPADPAAMELYRQAARNAERSGERELLRSEWLKECEDRMVPGRLRFRLAAEAAAAPESLLSDGERRIVEKMEHFYNR